MRLVIGNTLLVVCRYGEEHALRCYHGLAVYGRCYTEEARVNGHHGRTLMMLVTSSRSTRTFS